jgi:hypothetical protein
MILVIDEEGKLKADLQPNAVASVLADIFDDD